MKRRIERVVAIVSFAWINGVVAQTNLPSPLLAIDQHRTTVVERIVVEWGDKLAASGAGVTRAQLGELLFAMRADQLLAASLAGTLDGLRKVLAGAVMTTAPSRGDLMQTKALGDAADDVVYTPVTPCRLVETRGTFAAVYQGGGAFAGGEIRNYAIQGGNGVCLSQLPAGLNPSAVQLQLFGIPINSGASGDVEVLPQGTTFGSTATLVYLGTELITSASTTARINLANNQIGVQVRGGGANLAIDVVGYFRAPSGGFFAQGGNTFGTTAKLGTLDNQPLEIYVNNQRVMRYEADATSPKVVGGHPANVALASGATVAGGGIDSSCAVAGGVRPCANRATGIYAFVGAGLANLASGGASTVGGGYANTASGTSTVGGGYGNTATGDYSTVGGGQSNTASGGYSTVPGGAGNAASGGFSFAAGQGANAVHANSFVWSDGTPYNSEGDRHFTVHAQAIEFEGLESGRTAWVVLGKIAGQLIGTSSGGWLSDVGVWQSASDRNKKERFVPIDPQRVLARLVELPVMQWSYKAEPDVLRMGPVAQDFHAAFGLGPDDLTIAQTDESGVAFAAIQGLHQLVQEKDARIAALETAVAELKRIVEALATKQ